LGTWFAPDSHGAAIAAHLAASGVTALPGSDGAAFTSTAQVTLDDDGHAEYTFRLAFALPPIPATMAPVVVHTGSMGATFAPGGDAVLAHLRDGAGGATVIYDPNIRHGIMGAAAEVRPRVEDVVRAADVVKVSDEDLAYLYPDLGISPAHDPTAVIAAARRWLELGPAIVVVTRGPLGAVAATRSGLGLSVDAPQAQVADTVGAGDSFMAGLIDGLWAADLLGQRPRGRLDAIGEADLAAALARASVVSGITVSRPGANPPWAGEIAWAGPAGAAGPGSGLLAQAHCDRTHRPKR
jgi:fructokinase